MTPAARAENHLPDLKNEVFARRFGLAFGMAALLFLAVPLLTGVEWRDALAAAGSGEKLKTKDFVLAHAKWGTWWGCLVNGVICLALAGTSRWWASSGLSPAENSPKPSRPSRKEWLWLMVILAGAGALRWSRLDLSFYNDEAHGFRRYFAGQNQMKPDGTVKWRQASWAETFWLNKTGNNATPYSVLARLSYDGWRKISGAPSGVVSEAAIRLPAFASGMASLVVLWLLVRRLLPGTSVCWWLLVMAALHPWHVRYSTEARGYGSMLLGVTLFLYFAQRALEEGKWRWWLAMGTAQFFAVWCFSGSVYYLLTFNAGLLLLQSCRVFKSRVGWRGLAGPVLGMIVGAMLTLPLVLPMLPQLLDALALFESIHGRMGLPWWREVAGAFLGGIRWIDGDPANPENLSWARMVGAHPLLWLVLGGAVGISLAGLTVLWRRGGLARIVAAAGPLACGLAWISMSQGGNYLHLWYLIHSLPGWLALLAAGASNSAGLALGAATPGSRLGWMRPFLIAPLLAVWAWLSVDLASQGKEDIKGVASAIPEEALHAAVFSDVDVYDPDVVILHNEEDMAGIVLRARSEHRPLYISFSHKTAIPAFQQFFRHIETSPDLERVRVFYGLEEEQYNHYLYRLRRSED